MRLLSIFVIFFSLNICASESFLFIHGGPGFNSFADEAVLGLQFEANNLVINFWNEPSSLRPSGPEFDSIRAFEASYESALSTLQDLKQSQGTVHIIAHSFGAQIAVRLASSHPSLVESLILISPAFNLHQADRNIIDVAQMDFVSVGQMDKATKLEELKNCNITVFDSCMLEAMMIAMQDQALMLSYWVDYTKMQDFFSHLNSPEKASSVDEMIAVRSTMDTFSLKTKLSQRALLLFGKNDPVVRLPEQYGHILRYFDNFSVYVFENSGHFPHIEKTEDFIDLVQLL